MAAAHQRMRLIWALRDKTVKISTFRMDTSHFLIRTVPTLTHLLLPSLPFLVPHSPPAPSGVICLTPPRPWTWKGVAPAPQLIRIDVT